MNSLNQKIFRTLMMNDSPSSTAHPLDFNSFSAQAQQKRVTKTGTTIVGIKSEHGVILCADTRATSGPFVVDKACFKLHRISDDIYCAGAGTAADTDRVTSYASSMVRIFETKYSRKAPVKYVISVISKHLFQYQGAVSAALIVAGRYKSTYHLYSIAPDGTVNPGFYLSMGSGSLAAVSVLEARYRAGMSMHEIKELGACAVKAGIMNDLYSGSNVDCVVIDGTGTNVVRNFLKVAGTMTGKRIAYALDSVKVKKEEVFEIVEEVFE
ncbi:20S proteasome, regulatory subunit beta type PSMB7/PSMB10/PUP1 [Trachipleistophora hominis]|uniref:proteasome endopeptidase complex n=1 Tax=Trachipleistophora hominis TaxID=72359 RepID=L7JWX3_TRAHO|nr:20S proteasome, regulatory subunit beta type PSMB7/PSMB10/PUP1 [Trachipleistophora hominis]